MQKISTVKMKGKKILSGQLTIGLDLGDRSSCYCVLDENGEIIREQKIPTTPEGMQQAFGKMARSRIAMETGTHSPWVSRVLTELGHEVIVAHAQKVHANRSRTPELGEASQCASAISPHGDPCTSRTGERANRPGECHPRIGEVLRRTAAQMWHAASQSEDRERTKQGIAQAWSRCCERWNR